MPNIKPEARSQKPEARNQKPETSPSVKILTTNSP
jgi:hypothetical protein